VELSAGCDAPVLISTDEILDAKTIGSWIHGRSLRRAGPFVVLDSRTLDPDVQFEAIGRAQGSLPDLGAIDSLRGGTLLLLHLEKMPPETQERLCRFLERRESWDPAMFRVIAATDRAFAHVQAGDIREDLFYRLNVIHIVVGDATKDQAGVEQHGANTGERRGPTTDRGGLAIERRGQAPERRGPSRSAGSDALSVPAFRHCTLLPSWPR
jgi:transcriptional regulator of aromatic amino acid metabolism